MPYRNSLALGRRVQYLREQKHMTRPQLARESGVGESTIATLERGLSDPRLSTLEGVCDALGCSMASVLSSYTEPPGSHDVRLVEVGDRLRIARINSGVSMSEVARRSGCSRQTVANTEEGVSSVAITTFAAMCKAVGADPRYILMGGHLD